MKDYQYKPSAMKKKYDDEYIKEYTSSYVTTTDGKTTLP